MTANGLLLLMVIFSSLVPGIIIFWMAEDRVVLRSFFNIAGATLKIILVAWILAGILDGDHYELRLPLMPDIEFVLRAGPMAMFFVTLSSVLWLLTTIYAIGYLEGSPNRSRFFGFFSLCVTATVGVALSANMITFLFFYELLTLATYPLVVHRGTDEARAAGRVYLRYTISGGASILIATIWLYTLAGTLEFTPRGFVSSIGQNHEFSLILIFVLMIAGLGVKAAIIPLHGWLPMAMIAPAPVSALLHAVAVVKAGAFGVVRVVYEVFGVEFSAALGVLQPLAWLAAITIVYGSVRALYQDDLKRRLAFSTVSQVSYITLGVAIAGPIAAIGGIVHLVHQGLMKITLFFCAGNLAETLGVHKISEMSGVGKRMPWTMAAFTIGALGMIGVPPVAGFFSKWYLGMGALNVNQDWVILILAASSLLNAAYLLPILHIAWFGKSDNQWPRERACETSMLLLAPALVTATFSIAVGLFASHALSPLEWAKLISIREFYPK